MCSRVAGKNGHPCLDQLVQMRADRHGGCVSKDLLGREAVFTGGRIAASLLRYSETWL